MKPFFIYILECSDGSYYVGHTDDIEKRLLQHLSEENTCYTATRLPVKLVYLQEFLTRDEAIIVEHQVKKWSRLKKKALIDGEWDLLKKFSKKTNWTSI